MSSARTAPRSTAARRPAAARPGRPNAGTRAKHRRSRLSSLPCKRSSTGAGERTAPHRTLGESSIPPPIRKSCAGEFRRNPARAAIRHPQDLATRRQIRQDRSAAKVRGQRSEVRGQRSEVRGQRSEVRGQKSEVRGSGVRRQGRCQRSGCDVVAGRGQKVDLRGEALDAQGRSAAIREERPRVPWRARGQHGSDL